MVSRFLMSCILLTAVAALVSLSSQSQGELVSFSAEVPQSWRQSLSPVDPDHTLSITVALTQRNTEVLEQMLLNVSNPDSEFYGKYLSLEEISEILAPSSYVKQKVANFWYTAGADQVVETLSKDFLQISISVKSFETFFKVHFNEYCHAYSGRCLVRTEDSWTLPSRLYDLIDVVTGINDFIEYPSEKKGFMLSTAIYVANQTSAPDLYGRVYGGSNEVTPNIIIYCSNGLPTQQAEFLCSDNPPEVSQITLIATPRGQDPIVVSAGAGGSSAYNFSSYCHPYLNNTACWLHAFVPDYTRVTLESYVTYTDGSHSDIGKYATDFAPTSFILPETIFKTYNVPLGMRGRLANNSQSVVAFEKQYISLDDLSEFQRLVGLPQQAPTIHGENDPSMPGGESTLDIQYIMGIGAGVPTTFWSVSGDPRNGGYILEWALQISNTTTPPLVTSISYGDTEQGFNKIFKGWNYIDRMNIELQKMGLRGLTVMGGSGDAGASNVGEAGNDISYTDPTCTPFRPFFPSDSPYALSVGSTFLTTNIYPICNEDYDVADSPIICSEVGEASVSVNTGSFWTTGGGFSNHSASPSWQQTAVQQYIKSATSLPPSQYWNSSGRGYPDVATLGQNLLMVLGGQITPVAGTSASGPVMAGLISLWNEVRLQNNRPPLGFIAPLLYKFWNQHPESFQDVLVGDNYGGDLQARGSPYPSFCEYGFLCEPGWDPISGLGTPNWSKLVELDEQFFLRKSTRNTWS